jgi:hypothetical protein
MSCATVIAGLQLVASDFAALPTSNQSGPLSQTCWTARDLTSFGASSYPRRPNALRGIFELFEAFAKRLTNLWEFTWAKHQE